MANILNPTGAPAGGHAGYGKGAEYYGTERMENQQNHADPLTKSSKSFDSAPQSTTWAAHGSGASSVVNTPGNSRMGKGSKA